MDWKIVRVFMAAVMVALIAVGNAVANDIVRKVIFPKGKNSVVYKGKLPGEYATYHAYTLKLKKGQRLTVTLTTSDVDASFSIYETRQLGPTEDLIFDSKPDYRQYSGVMPLTSEYSIQIYGVKDIDDKPSRAAYSIDITVLK